MKFARSAFVALVAMLIAAGAVRPEAARAQNSPLAGTWNLVPEQSTFTPGSAGYQSLTMTIPESGEGAVTVEGVDAQGRPVKGTFTAVADGKPHPITGFSAYDTGVWSRNSDTNTSYRYLKGRGVVVLGTRVLSPDGNVLAFREQTYDSRGRPAGTAMMIFARPGAQLASLSPNSAGASAAPQTQTQSALNADETAATEALTSGNDDEAIRLFTKAIEAQPPSPVLYYDYFSRGIAYARKEEHEKALADFDAALRLKPDYIEARFRRGGTRAQLEQYQAAIEDLTAVIEAEPMNAAAYRLRAYAYNRLDDANKAGPDFEKACALDRNFCN